MVRAVAVTDGLALGETLGSRASAGRRQPEELVGMAMGRRDVIVSRSQVEPGHDGSIARGAGLLIS
jgi:hypothetical protein